MQRIPNGISNNTSSDPAVGQVQLCDQPEQMPTQRITSKNTLDPGVIRHLSSDLLSRQQLVNTAHCGAR